jgi:hypothetical protein
MVHIHINKEKTEGCCEELTENMQQVWILFRAFFRKAKAKSEVWKLQQRLRSRLKET